MEYRVPRYRHKNILFNPVLSRRIRKLAKTDAILNGELSDISTRLSEKQLPAVCNSYRFEPMPAFGIGGTNLKNNEGSQYVCAGNVQSSYYTLRGTWVAAVP
jgi:hypothetical protein